MPGQRLISGRQPRKTVAKHTMTQAARAPAPTTVAAKGSSLRQLIERANPDELQAMERALLEPAPGELQRLVWLRKLGEAAQEGASTIAGVEALLLSPAGDDVIFLAPISSVDLEDKCSALLQKLQEELAPEGQPLLQGGVFERPSEAFEGYQRLDIGR